MDNLTTEYTLICMLHGSLMWLGYFWCVINGCLYNQAKADVRSTGAGIMLYYRLYSAKMPRAYIWRTDWIRNAFQKYHISMHNQFYALPDDWWRNLQYSLYCKCHRSLDINLFVKMNLVFETGCSDFLEDFQAAACPCSDWTCQLCAGR